MYVLYIQLIVAEFITINLQRRIHEKKIRDATFKNVYGDGNMRLNETFKFRYYYGVGSLEEGAAVVGASVVAAVGASVGVTVGASVESAEGTKVGYPLRTLQRSYGEEA